MARNTFRGKKQFINRLEKLKRVVADEIIAAQAANAADMAALARAWAPRDQGGLAESTKVEKYERVAGYARHRVVSGVSGNAPGGGAGRKPYYARWVEFGTALRRATPYFYPAYRTLRRKFRRRLSAAFKRGRQKVMK